MPIQEPDTLAELIDDCAEIPAELRPTSPAVPLPRAASPWRVTDDCLRQVEDLDEYI